MIEKQMVRHFVQYTECLSYPASLLCNSNKYPFSQIKDLSQPRFREAILANREILIPLIGPLV